MGMRVGSSSQAASSQSSSASVSKWQERQQNFKALTTALQAGDLSAAKSAYATLEAGNSKNSSGSNSSSESDSNNPLSQLGQALQSGDLAAAQQAAQAIQSKHGGHHHHHSEQAPATQNTPTPVASGNVGTIVNTSV